MSLTSLNDLTISSADGRVVITAEKEVWIGAGGSYIQIGCNGIVNGSPAEIQQRCASWSKTGPHAEHVPIPRFPLSQDEEVIEQSFSLLKDGGTAIDEYHYDLYSDGDLHTHKGRYANGATSNIAGPASLKFVTWIARDSARKDA